MNNKLVSPERAKGIRVGGTFTFLGIHFVFSTKNRVPLLDNTIHERLFSYMMKIIFGNKEMSFLPFGACCFVFKIRGLHPPDIS
ncbi:MAG: hypothetical protein DYG83_16530 [Candidatus Brocadia sp. AMX2]|uniref:Transposase and inactivated derivatives n=1 Tax=Candidatus Brocadia sinica JPN1 TaxID=1197129 RepID=A0ABQ0K1A0_9BACT|nr:MAG: hypothetical protein EDM70_14610 [Candidatus Brocadia sp. AMX2]MBC6933483.1 hypothetical protein [Candidatus Brocadia sp.]MBL1170292.1 hypothetical protein [Candidatus Brocadia sp. AMX1]GAN34713.1 transposase and inactivated derivatives [Candidatus Brocadia sinica JPN1]MCE7868389.1 hypothetical protein [Candidatus Brocadia sp. AMX2]